MKKYSVLKGVAWHFIYNINRFWVRCRRMIIDGCILPIIRVL